MCLNDWRVGHRYIHTKRGVPVTLRYIGSLPPDTGGQQWLGVEYDDPALGKHDGTFEGREIFHVDRPGSGAFVKSNVGVLASGPTFVEAIEDRYGPIVPVRREQYDKRMDDRVVLGKSGIMVEAPGIEDVQKRIRALERLREMGMDGQWISNLGGSEPILQVLTSRLKGVTTLDLSRNLLCGWADVQSIVDHLQGLRTLVLNHSRLARLPRDSQAETLASLSASFTRISELHLGDAGINDEAIVELSLLFPKLHVLHVNDNPRLTRFNHPSFRWDRLTTLSLSNCPLARWDDIANIVHGLPSLTTLHISGMPFNAILTPGSRCMSSVTSIVMSSSRITRWTDMDALEQWTRGQLVSLRFSPEWADHLEEEARDRPKQGSPQEGQISGIPEVDRPFFIASLSGLTMLNSTAITISERRDAETHYVNHVTRLRDQGHTSRWGRYDELLAKIHPEEVAPKPVERARSSALKSKMLKLHVCIEGRSRDEVALEISVLPSTPALLLRKKIAKKLNLNGGFALYTARAEGFGWEKVIKLEDDEKIGSWLSDGDTIMVVEDEVHSI